MVKFVCKICQLKLHWALVLITKVECIYRAVPTESSDRGQVKQVSSTLNMYAFPTLMSKILNK
jgi:hypothetical protein